MKISEASATRQPALPSDGRVVLSIRGLRKSFGGLVVLDSVNADLHQGEIVLLRGENGSGKTTLLNILTGNLEPDAGTVHLRANGEEEYFHFPRRWWQGLNPFDHFTPERVAREGVGRTWQDVRLFPALTLLENIAVAKPAQRGENPLRALVSRARTTAEFANRQTSAALLADLNLAGRECSSGDKISLGQSKRVAIARAVHGGARILFLDEPLSGLDAVGIEEVLGLLSSLAKNERLTLVLVEHTFNIPRILEFANTVWTLRAGQIFVQTPAEVRADYVAELGDGPVALIARHLGGGYQREDISLYRGARLTRFVPAEASLNRPVLLEVRDLIVYRGSRLVVGQKDSTGKEIGLSLRLHEGDIAILQAPNGWGKTTLFDFVAGKISPDSGSLRLAGTAVELLSICDRVNRGLRMSPAGCDLFPTLKVTEVMALAAANSEPGNLSDFGDRLYSSLSGGQKQRVTLAAALNSANIKALVLDEPFAMLDIEAAAAKTARLCSGTQRTTLILIPSR